MKVRKTYSTAGIILFLLSLMYLGAELVFNRQLLDVSSSVRSDPEQVEHLQYFGRMASGFGFTLLVLGIFQPFGFRISGRKQWVIFSAITFICLLPFIMTFGQIVLGMATGGHAENDTPYVAGMIWGFLPFIGLYCILASRGRRPLAVILGLMILAWPAMFYGQKLAVERFIISPTTAEDRLNAHYILLLRSGIEDCVILLEGAQLCDDHGEVDVEKRSTRAILGSLFMLNTPAVFSGLSFSRDQIIDSMSAKEMWFSSGQYYQRYLQQVTEKYQQYAQLLDEKYYLPYKQASDLYLKALNDAANFSAQASQPGHLEKMAEEPALQVRGEIERGWKKYQELGKMAEESALQVNGETEQGWQKYQKAVTAYNNISVGMASQAEQVFYTKLCKGHEAACERAVSKKHNGMSIEDAAFAQIQKSAAENFYQQTGYTPDIKDKGDFLKDPKTQDELRSHIEQKIRKEIAGYTLPTGWKYDPLTIKDELFRLMQNTEQGKAKENFYQQAGYPPDIKDKDDFLKDPKTQNELRSHIEQKIREKIAGYTLPPRWQYDPLTFKDELLHLMQNEAQGKAMAISDRVRKTWRDKVQSRFKADIEPGLSREDFFKYLGGGPLPSLKDMVMSESDFREKYIVPVNRNIADKAIEKIRNDAPAYANGQKLAEQGKDYIRVLYIPAIALCLSIVIVVITIGRYFAVMTEEVTAKAPIFRFLTERQRSLVRPVCWAVFLAMVLALPYLWPNPYTSTPAYQKYYHLARERSPGTALLLDWIVHMQPIIYRASAHMPKVTYME